MGLFDSGSSSKKAPFGSSSFNKKPANDNFKAANDNDARLAEKERARKAALEETERAKKLLAAEQRRRNEQHRTTLRAEVARLTTEQVHWQNNLREIDTELTEAKEQIQTSKKALEEVTSTKRQTLSEAGEEHRKLEEFREKLDQAEAEIRHLGAQQETLRHSEAQSRGLQDIYSAEMRKREIKKTELETRHRTIITEQEGLKVRIKQLETELAAAKQKLQSSTGEDKQVMQEVATVQRAIVASATTASASKNAEASHKKEVDEIARKLELLKRHKAEIEAQKETVERAKREREAGSTKIVHAERDATTTFRSASQIELDRTRRRREITQKLDEIAKELNKKNLELSTVNTALAKAA